MHLFRQILPRVMCSDKCHTELQVEISLVNEERWQAVHTSIEADSIQKHELLLWRSAIAKPVYSYGFTKKVLRREASTFCITGPTSLSTNSVACIKNPGGLFMWWGCISGITIKHPEMIRKTSRQPRSQISRFLREAANTASREYVITQ